jgi:hypothetical protein
MGQGGYRGAEHRRRVSGTPERIRRRVRIASRAPYGTAGAARTQRSVPAWNYFETTLFRMVFTLAQNRGRFPGSFSAGIFDSGRS